MDDKSDEFHKRGMTEVGKHVVEFALDAGFSLKEIASWGIDTSAAKKSARKAGGGNARKTPIAAVHAGHRQRLRERVKHDERLDSFSDVEILEILLSYIIPQYDTNVISHKLIETFGSLSEVMTAMSSELSIVKGMTGDAAWLLPVLWRLCKSENRLDIVINSLHDVINIFYSQFVTKMKSGLYLAFVDGDSNLLAIERVPVEYKKAYRAAASSVVNHGASGVFVFWVDDTKIGMDYDAVDYAHGMGFVLDSVNAVLLDFVMLTVCGYYMSGPRPLRCGEWYPKFLFRPEIGFSRSSRAIDAIIDSSESFE